MEDNKSKLKNKLSTESQVINEETKTLTRIFYGLIGIAASLALFLAFYWNLRLNSSIASLISNTSNEPLYFWPYVLLTFGTVILFGVNVSLFTYRWRKFGPPKLRGQLGTGLGSLVGVAASACPVCGSLLLSAIGIAGGLAAFPLQGLELKALSFFLMAFPLWIAAKDFKSLNHQCKAGLCPPPNDPVFKESDKTWLLILVLFIAIVTLSSWNMLKTDPAVVKVLAARSQGISDPNNNQRFGVHIPKSDNQLFNEVAAKVLPEKGFQSRIALKDSVLKLIENGVLDRAKFESIYQSRGGLPSELKNIFNAPSRKPILLTRQNANIYVNLLWPIGLSNYMSTNEESPIKGRSLFNFASTGGWNLGKEENGGAYFNKFKIVPLTPEEENLVTRIAKNTFRPCCDNSTFFQDCNHGSALLGLLALGASQGLSEKELYREALAFNSFWFPDIYIQTALYFKAVKNVDWKDVDPTAVMGKDFSSISGWSRNVNQKLADLNLLPQIQGGGGCGV